MTAIVKVINLLPIFLVEYQEVKLIGELNQLFHFDHNIFVLDSSVDRNRFISRQKYIPQSVYVYKSVDDKITGLERLRKIKSKNTLLVVVAEGATFDSNFNLLKRMQKIQQLQTKMKIGLFLPNVAYSENVKALFEWCKEQLIVNIFAVTYAYPNAMQGVSSEPSLNISTFHPFGTFKVMNVTGVETCYSYFPSLNSNFQQHKLRVLDPLHPLSVKILWLTVFRLMNASFVIVPITMRTDDDFGTILYENQIDIVPRLQMIYGFTGDQMYPLIMEPQVIIVPKAEPYSDFSAYLRTVTSDEFFVYSLITIAAVMLLLNCIRYIKQKKFLFFQSVADVLNLLLNDNGHIKYQQMPLVEIFIIVPLTFVGLIIVNGFLSNMQSYLTRPVLLPQIKTIEDIYTSPFPIHTLEDGWKNELVEVLTDLTKYENWNSKIFSLEEQQYNEQIETYDTSSFLTELYTANQLLQVQKSLNVRGFYNPQIQMFNFFTAYIVFEKFLFFERLDEIVHRIKSAGLYDLWVRRGTSAWTKQIIKRNNGRLKIQNKSVGNFEFPIIVVYGWMLSVTVFVIEIIWKKLKSSRKFGQFYITVAETFIH